ncbi:MAG: CinA family nicotinamide mononucleotide deamidase-related protein [Anaerolineales bacterium]|nr:MAG: CinA family nicotinamide mononucleotide deamidase-related protein [Anaerolineales bacterium]
MEAEIITIGTELLLGELVDTNTRYIARALREIGLDLYRTSTVGDNIERIAEEVQASMQRADAVITTGGLGPTIDDPTREGIAKACGVETIFVPELWQQIEERFAGFGSVPTENNRRQAYIPAGAIPIENPVGTAPGFIVETDRSVAISLPGVPAEMQHLLVTDVIPYLKQRLGLQSIIKSRIVRTAGIGESMLDHKIEDLEKLHNPTVGLSAHPGRVDIRITAKAKTDQEADKMIASVEATLEQRIGRAIYGKDDQTLESVVIGLLKDKGMHLALLEAGTDGALAASLAEFPEIIASEQILSEAGSEEALSAALKEDMRNAPAQAGLLLAMQPSREGSTVMIQVLLPDNEHTDHKSYEAHFVNMKTRAVSYALLWLRRLLLFES